MNDSWLISAVTTSIDTRPFRKTISASLFFVGCCVLVGCSQPVEEEARKFDPVLREDAEKFRGLLEKAVVNRDNRTFVELFSKTAMFDRVFSDLELKPSHKRGIEGRINRGGNVNAIAKSIFELLDANNGSYEFVRYEEVNGEQTLMFRLDVPSEMEVEYHRYHLTRTPRGKVRAFDLFSYLQNDFLTYRLRRKVIQLLHAENELDLKSQQEFAKELTAEPIESPEFQKLAELVIEEDWIGAMGYCKTIPTQIRNSRVVQIQRLLVAERLSMEEYEKVLSEFRESHPNDIQKEFNSIRFFRKQKAYQKIIVAVDRVIKRVQDPYLQHLKLGALIDEGKLLEAEKILEEFKTRNWLPKIILIHRLEWLVARRDFPGAVEVLSEMKDKHSVQIENIDSLPRYTDLIKSQEYKEWKDGSKN